MPRDDYYTNTVADAAAFNAYYNNAVEYDDGPTLADVADDGIDRDEDDRFAVNAKGNCTMCGGDGQMDNCPGMCSHESCAQWECPQCEGECSREIIEEVDPS